MSYKSAPDFVPSWVNLKLGRDIISGVSDGKKNEPEIGGIFN